MKALYNLVFKRTSTYAVGIMASVFIFERTFDLAAENIFFAANKGVSIEAKNDYSITGQIHKQKNSLILETVEGHQGQVRAIKSAVWRCSIRIAKFILQLNLKCNKEEFDEKCIEIFLCFPIAVRFLFPSNKMIYFQLWCNFFWLLQDQSFGDYSFQECIRFSSFSGIKIAGHFDESTFQASLCEHFGEVGVGAEVGGLEKLFLQCPFACGGFNDWTFLVMHHLRCHVFSRRCQAESEVKDEIRNRLGLEETRHTCSKSFFQVCPICSPRVCVRL